MLVFDMQTQERKHLKEKKKTLKGTILKKKKIALKDKRVEFLNLGFFLTHLCTLNILLHATIR